MWTGYSSEHNKTWYPADNFENADLAKQNLHCRYRDKLHLNQTRGTRQRRHTRLHGASTKSGKATPITTANTNPSAKLRNPNSLGGDDTDKLPILLTFGLGKGGTEAKRTRCTRLDSVLQRQLLGTRQREIGTRMVAQEITC